MANVRSCVLSVSETTVQGLKEKRINPRKRRIVGGLESALYCGFDGQTV